MPFQPKASALLSAALWVMSASLVAQTPAPAPAPAPAAQAPAPKAQPAPRPPVQVIPRKHKIKPVDLNRCSKKELMEVPGMSSAAADKIIAHRPYLTKSKLATNGVISVLFYQSIKDNIFVFNGPASAIPSSGKK